jgi:hypothetical protein
VDGVACPRSPTPLSVAHAAHNVLVFQQAAGGFFRVPKQYLLVSVGQLVKEWREDNFAVTEWQSDTPLAVAGFNYGSYKKKEVHDDTTKYDVETYVTTELPDYLRHASQFGSMTPSAPAQNAMVDAENAVRCFTAWFGDLPYGRLAITQQPEFNFGQSWPTLIYLPISAFLDSTQRWSLLGENAFKFAEFIDESHAPRSVAPVVGPCRRLGFLSRSVAFRGIRRLLSRIVPPAVGAQPG